MKTAVLPKDFPKRNRCNIEPNPAGQYAGFFSGLGYNRHMEHRKIEIRRFNELDLRDLYEILRARVDVFVVEQNCLYPELDGIDYDAIHMFMKDESGTVISCLRIFENRNGELQIGRVLTRKRNAHLGQEILHAAVEYIDHIYPGRPIVLEAQTYAIGFYEKEGFRVISEEFLEDGIPHVKMQRDTATGD